MTSKTNNFKRDRQDDRHSGILVYVKQGIPCKHLGNLELVNNECFWIQVNVRNKTILIGTFYRPPNA